MWNRGELQIIAALVSVVVGGALAGCGSGSDTSASGIGGAGTGGLAQGSGAAGGSVTASSGTSGTGGMGGSGGTGGTGGAKTCDNPAFVTSDTNGGWSTQGYYVHNNMWNSNCCQTLYACAYNNWYVISNQINEAGAVKTYPNVHKDYSSKPISSFSILTSTFAATTPQVGIYNAAYDVWINGIAAPGGAEVMIWTENFNQVPGGNQVDTVQFGSVTWNVWMASWSWTYIAFVPTSPLTYGSLDLLEFFNWVITKGWIPPSSTIDQIGFGVEIVSTDGNDETFTVTDFSISDGT